MSGSDWSKDLKAWGGIIATSFVAAVLVIVVIETALLHQRDLRNEAARNATHYSESAKDDIVFKCVGLSAQARRDCSAKINEAARENQRKEYDLYSQSAMALWTSVMGGMAVVGVALSIIGVFLIYRTLNATRETLNEARATTTAASEANAIMRREQRAWLSVNAISDKIEVIGSYILINITAEVRNIGASPALTVCLDLEYIPDDPLHVMIWHQKATDFFRKALERPNRWLSTSILPSDDPIFISQGAPDIMEESIAFPMKERSFLIAYSVTYSIERSDERGQTAGVILVEIMSDAVPSDSGASMDMVYKFRPPDAAIASDIVTSNMISPKVTR